MQVVFHEEIKEELIAFVVIIAKHHNEFVYCRHRERSDWELPGGHREKGETPLEAAMRELHEETGAAEFIIEAISPYSVRINGEDSYGKLYFAEIESFEKELTMEIEQIKLFDDEPENQVYPEIHPLLMKKYKEIKKLR